MLAGIGRMYDTRKAITRLGHFLGSGRYIRLDHSD